MLPRRLEDAALRWLSERPLRYLHTVPPRAARGLLARVYRQVARDYVLAGPITVHSISPELTAGLWMYGRETVLAADALDRGTKEAIAAAVSVTNRCPYCRDMHTSMAHSAGAHDLAVAVLADADQGPGADVLAPAIAWARASRTPGAPVLEDPPFTAPQMAEAIGTVVFFHYINRVVNVFFEDTALRLPVVGAVLTDRLTRGFGFVVRPRMTVDTVPGESLDLLPEAPLPDDLAWADHPTIGPAVARWAAALDAAACRHAPTSVRTVVGDAIDDWSGADPPLGSAWLEERTAELPAEDRAIAELALLTALASYRVTDARVRALTERGAGEETLLVTVAWAAGLAARRVSSWVAGGLPSRSPRTPSASPLPEHGA